MLHNSENEKRNSPIDETNKLFKIHVNLNLCAALLSPLRCAVADLFLYIVNERF